MMNGIPDLGSRPDFADRTVHVTLKPIPASERRSEVKYWREVDTRLPLIFGALLDAVAGALRNRDIVPPPVTRMADFETWVCAAEPALGWKEGEFIAAYTGNRQGTIEAALEADPLAGAVRQLVEKEDWSGSPTELLTRLDGLVSDGVRKGRTWPAAANALKKRLQRWQTALRETGVLLDLDGRSNDRKRGRFYSIRRDRGTEPS